jgi:hypothetical protein
MTLAAILSFVRQLIPYYLAFDGLVFAMMLYQEFASNATLDWSSVPGKMLTSKVVYKSGANRYTSPAVTYAYEVAGKAYQGETILPGWIKGSGPKVAQRIVARYPKGAQVTVHYDPADPSKACLERYSLAQAQEWKWLIPNLLLPLFVLLASWFVKP